MIRRTSSGRGCWVKGLVLDICVFFSRFVDSSLSYPPPLRMVSHNTDIPPSHTPQIQNTSSESSSSKITPSKITSCLPSKLTFPLLLSLANSQYSRWDLSISRLLGGKDLGFTFWLSLSSCHDFLWIAVGGGEFSRLILGLVEDELCRLIKEFKRRDMWWRIVPERRPMRAAIVK